MRAGVPPSPQRDPDRPRSIPKTEEVGEIRGLMRDVGYRQARDTRKAVADRNQRRNQPQRFGTTRPIPRSDRDHSRADGIRRRPAAVLRAAASVPYTLWARDPVVPERRPPAQQQAAILPVP